MASPIDIRPALRADIPALMRMKRALMVLVGPPDLPCATEQDWLRDAIGPRRCFSVVVAAHQDAIVGMAIYMRKHIPGIAASILYLHDLFKAKLQSLIR